MSNKMNDKGVTLVEVMISMVILLVVFMGLIQASLLTINHNLRNEARDEAVRIGAGAMALLRSFNYSCSELDPTGTAPLVAGGTTCTNTLTTAQKGQINTPQRSFRNLSINYTVTKVVDRLDNTLPQPDTKRLTVTVQWRYPGDDLTSPPQSHTIYYTLRNPVQ